MVFELIDFLSWPWLVTAHLVVVGLVLGPFFYIWMREQVVSWREERKKD